MIATRMMHGNLSLAIDLREPLDELKLIESPATKPHLYHHPQPMSPVLISIRALTQHSCDGAQDPVWRNKNKRLQVVEREN